ncbi:MAG: NUDIX domain-containing protein [Rhizobiales bacterium]|nr:NUDIX domain-containing protein [Hyphomicrobiales bacterium]
MARTPILAAGGVVMRGSGEPLIAVVQLRNRNWVLPKGKLKRKENALAAAKREVLEETGHKVSVREQLGSISYEVGGRRKVVRFWRMEAFDKPAGKLMDDVKAVRWLPLGRAVKQLTHRREQAFLRDVGLIAINAARRSARQSIALKIWMWLCRKTPRRWR